MLKRGMPYTASQAAAEINSWVESVTNGLIKNIIRDISNSTILVVANALYFKGSWSREFEKRLTCDRIFYLLNRQTIRIPFMTQFGRQSFRAFKEFKVLKLPYSNGQENKYFNDGEENKNFSMYFILPHEKDGLKKLIAKISSDVSFFSQDFMLEKVELDDFAIPKFKISFHLDASKIVQELGLTLPFKATGEISNMVKSAEGLRISQIIHRSCVEVNEEGTTAAAATVMAMMSGSCGPLSPREPRPTFVADHPFMFMIREETSRMVLFIGTVLDPSSVS